VSRQRKRTGRPQCRPSRPRPAPAVAPRSWSLPVVSLAAIGAALLAIAVLAIAQPAAGDRSGSNLPASGRPAIGPIVTPSVSTPERLAAGATLGTATAPVTLEIWSDFQCPYCGELARSYLPRVAADFVATGAVRIVAQDIAFLDRGGSTESHDAAVAAACAADQGRYWAFHDLLMWNQSGENLGAFSGARLAAMADQVPLDRPAWDACRAAPSAAADVATRAARAGALGIVSTPTLVINGQAIVGLPKTYDLLATALRGAID